MDYNLINHPSIKDTKCFFQFLQIVFMLVIYIVHRTLKAKLAPGSHAVLAVITCSLKIETPLVEGCLLIKLFLPLDTVALHEQNCYQFLCQSAFLY